MTLTTKSVILGIAFLAAVLSIKSALYRSSLQPKMTSLLVNEETNFGNDFHLYFADIEEKKNEDWWTWSFEYRWSHDKRKLTPEEKEEISEKFNGFTSLTKFKEVCKAAYSSTTETIFSDEKYSKSVWRYCSMFDNKPLTLFEAKNKNEIHFLNVKPASSFFLANKDELISTEDPQNESFWHEKEKFFLSGKIKVSNSENTENRTMFETFLEIKKRNKKSKEALKDICAKAYKLIAYESPDSERLKEEVKKYCGLKIQKVTPTPVVQPNIVQEPARPA